MIRLNPLSYLIYQLFSIYYLLCLANSQCLPSDFNNITNSYLFFFRTFFMPCSRRSLSN